MSKPLILQLKNLIDNLSNKIVPTGGTTGQVLMKNTSTNNDVKWGNIEKNGVIKQVNGLNIKASQTYTDADIKKANQVVLYYSIHALKYKRSLIIAKGDDQWVWDSEAEWQIFIQIDWDTGKILVSSYSTANDNVCLLGYDLIK